MKRINLLKMLLHAIVMIVGSFTVFGATTPAISVESCSDLHFTEQNVTKTTDLEFKRTPIGGNGGTIIYTSSNPAVASVNPTSGDVVLGLPGVAVITATQAEFCGQCGGEASYTIAFSVPTDCASMALAGDTLFTEDFNAYGSDVDFSRMNSNGNLNGGTTPDGKWTAACGHQGSEGSRNYFGIRDQQFQVNGVRGQTNCGNSNGGYNDNYLTSQNIDLAGYEGGYLTLSYEFTVDEGTLEGLRGESYECGATDEAESSYRFNNTGEWQIIDRFYGDGGVLGDHSKQVDCIPLPETGLSNVQIRFKMGTQSQAEFYYLDNILVTAIKAFAEDPEEPCVSPIIDTNGSLPAVACVGTPLDLECKAPRVLNNDFLRKGWLLDDVIYMGGNVTQADNGKTLKYYAVNSCDSVVILMGNIAVANEVYGTDIQEHCDSYTWIDGLTYTSSNNTATHTLTNAIGCDSIVTLNLTIKEKTSGTDVQVHCDSYTWIDGVTYTSSNNTAIHTLTNAAGCDSIVTLHLIIKERTFGTDIQVHCDSYTWIDGITYTSSNNTATHTLINAVGCDSIVTLHLTINESTVEDVYRTISSNDLPYDFRGNIIPVGAESDVYHFEGASSTQCDSIVNLHLTVEPVDVQEADLRIEILHVSSVCKDEIFDVMIELLNNGVSSATNVAVSVDIPENFTYVSTVSSTNGDYVSGMWTLSNPVVNGAKEKLVIRMQTMDMAENIFTEVFVTEANASNYTNYESSIAQDRKTITVKTIPSDIIMEASKDIIVPGELVEIIVASTFYDEPEYIFSWQGTDFTGKEFEKRFYQDTEIRLQVADAEGICPAVDYSLPIKVIWPTAFTPYSKDGYNDDFLGGTEFYLTVFNRYGIKMYEGRNGWDGHYKGSIADPGTYFYVAELPNEGIKKGTIEIVKEK